MTLFNAARDHSLPNTIVDDALALAAFLFLLCTYTLFICLRTKTLSLALTLERFADALFLCALTIMVGSGFIMVYTIW